jgi:hypothetical protein
MATWSERDALTDESKQPKEFYDRKRPIYQRPIFQYGFLLPTWLSLSPKR